eukprot:scaffold69294_cov47-Prasinocladus_malaysianus.AAC.2
MPGLIRLSRVVLACPVISALVSRLVTLLCRVCATRRDGRELGCAHPMHYVGSIGQCPSSAAVRVTNYYCLNDDYSA